MSPIFNLDSQTDKELHLRIKGVGTIVHRIDDFGNIEILTYCGGGCPKNPNYLNQQLVLEPKHFFRASQFPEIIPVECKYRQAVINTEEKHCLEYIGYREDDGSRFGIANQTFYVPVLVNQNNVEHELEPCVDILEAHKKAIKELESLLALDGYELIQL